MKHHDNRSMRPLYAAVVIGAVAAGCAASKPERRLIAVYERRAPVRATVSTEPAPLPAPAPRRRPAPEPAPISVAAIPAPQPAPAPPVAATASPVKRVETERVRIGAGRLELADKVEFATNKDLLRTESKRLLDEVAYVLDYEPRITGIRIEGHTDSRGSARYNKDLSARRAASVRTYLIEQGLAAGRFAAVGFGEEKPVDTNETRTGRAANRRVEFFIAEVDGRPASSVDWVTQDERPAGDSRSN